MDETAITWTPSRQRHYHSPPPLPSTTTAPLYHPSLKPKSTRNRSQGVTIQSPNCIIYSIGSIVCKGASDSQSPTRRVGRVNLRVKCWQALFPSSPTPEFGNQQRCARSSTITYSDIPAQRERRYTFHQQSKCLGRNTNRDDTVGAANTEISGRAAEAHAVQTGLELSRGLPH